MNRKGSEKIKQRLNELFSSQKLAVLSTHDKGQPYSSLVCFASTDDLKQIMFATSRNTRKYANLKTDSRVAFLIDNRTNQDADIHRAIAATATGKAEIVGENERGAFLKPYLAKHPYLEDFVRASSCALISVKVEFYYLVTNFQKVTEIHVGQ
jgi:nitroimidazol reductase NimA-like FMN-containing flavoprotein (pyridoxamine 5'-phosphate oxidase superfamily)